MKLTFKIITYLTLVVVLIMVPSAFLVLGHQKNIIMEQAKVRAKTLFQMIVVTRQWVAENRDLVKPVPAEVTKQLSQYAAYMADFDFHITSDKLVNPENAPDAFEERAIVALRTGLPEYEEMEFVEGTGNVYRYIAPLYINEYCLTCHHYQGYKVGDFRGAISVTIPLADLEAALSKSNAVFYLIILIGLSSIVFAVTLLMHKLVLRHLNTLTAAAGDIMQGNYQVRTAIDTDDEIADLSLAFDSMSERIAQHDMIMREKLDDAVSKYIALVDELKGKNNALASMNRFKTDVIDSISHEIRTPLTKIFSAAELLSDSRLMNDETRRIKFAETMRRNVVSLKNLFNDIITMSRLEHDQHEYHLIPVPLKAMIADVLADFDAEITEKNLRIQMNIAEDAYVCVDGETFNYVLTNVIGNAIKYNRQGGEIRIGKVCDEKYKEIVIQDTGVGIPAHELEKVLSRFYRGENVKSSHPGTGLGLSIVQRVMEGHKGEIRIESVENEYTIVHIRVPRSNLCS